MKLAWLVAACSVACSEVAPDAPAAGGTHAAGADAGGVPAAPAAGAASAGTKSALGGAGGGASAGNASLGGAAQTAGASTGGHGGVAGAHGGGSASTCPSLFCEDFEGASFDAGPWQVEVSGQNTASLSQSQHAHGQQALAIHYAGTRNTWALLRSAAVPASLATHLFGRAQVRLSAPLPDRHAVLLTAGSLGFPNDEYLEVAAVGSTWQASYVDLKQGGGEDYESGGAIPQGSWFCLEWELNDNPDQVTVWVDGALALTASFSFGGNATGLVDGFSSFALGIRLWGSGAADQPLDLYYDDLALSSERVGCDAVE